MYAFLHTTWAQYGIAEPKHVTHLRQTNKRLFVPPSSSLFWWTLGLLMVDDGGAAPSCEFEHLGNMMSPKWCPTKTVALFGIPCLNLCSLSNLCVSLHTMVSLAGVLFFSFCFWATKTLCSIKTVTCAYRILDVTGQKGDGFKSNCSLMSFPPSPSLGD